VGDYVVIPDNLHHGQLQMHQSFPTSYGSGLASPNMSGLQGTPMPPPPQRITVEGNVTETTSS
jgi:hypothetical protein